jgi:cardiolipin synthase
MALVFADLTISTAWAVLGTIALCAATLVILIALFGPGLRYTIATPSSENPGSQEFAAALEALTDSKLNGSVELTVLTNGPCFYEAELAAIASAKRSVCLEAYIFRKGEIANRYVAALTERARAGVEVNVLLDALGSFRITEHSFCDFKAAGGKLAWYNPARWNRLPRYDSRTHRELLIVDGKIGFIGGAGIADQWYRGENGQPGWRDTMVRVIGPALANLQATFAENWLEGCGNLLIGEAYFPSAREDSSSGKTSSSRPIASPDEAAAMVVSSSPTTGGSTRARILFQLLLASARKTIHINTPYFLPDASLSNELEKAIRERGVEVKVIVPGRKSDIWLTRTSSRRKYGPLLRAGAHIFEYQPAMIHAKVLMVDGLWGVVGSTNCDYRSFGLNDEVNLAARDQGFVQRLAEDFERDLANSREITYAEWSNRSIFERAPELLGWVFQRQQ